jgi:sporulation protein YlmC with PRC-barrel domain
MVGFSCSLAFVKGWRPLCLEIGKQPMRLFALGLLAAMTYATPVIAQAVDPNPIIIGQGPNRYLAKDSLIGVKVHDEDGTIIGDIEDLLITDRNVIMGVIVGTGGVLGIGEKRVGIRLTALQFEEKDNTTRAVFAGATQQTMKDAPAFKRSKAKKSLLQRATEKAKELTDKTSATTKDAYEKAKPTIDAAKESVKETYEKAKEAAKPAVDAAKEAVTPEPTPTE